MKADEFFNKVVDNELCYSSEEIIAVSDDYCMDCHKIVDIRWNQDRARFEIVITKY